MKKTPIARAVEASIPASPEVTPTPAPQQAQIEERATMLVRQMINDHLNTLPPASREITATYISQIMQRVVVLAVQ